MSKTWLCRCGHRNDALWRKCRGDSCNRSKPRKRRPAHMLALALPYDGYIELNGRIHQAGEECALCGRERRDVRLDRDHDHRTGKPRGLLCAPCNMRLRNVDDLEWLAGAMRYLARAETYWESAA